MQEAEWEMVEKGLKSNSGEMAEKGPKTKIAGNKHFMQGFGAEAVNITLFREDVLCSNQSVKPSTV